MKIIYKPKRDTNYNLIPGADVGLAVLLPDGYPGNKKWPYQLSVHGIGERSGGTEESLRNLVIGVDYNKDGKVDSVYVTPGQREAVDKYGIIIVVPTYESNTFFNPAQAHWVSNYMEQNYAVMPKYWYDGFSYGAGAALAAITDPLTAPNIAYCTPCAPTNSLSKTGIPLISMLKIPVHIYVNDEDDNAPTNLSVTKEIIAAINATNPSIKAVFTAFDRAGHGSHEEATTITPPKASGGQGLIDAAENEYQVFLDILANGPRQMKTGTVTPVPEPIPLPTTVVAKADYSIDGYQIHLIGDKSTGFKQGYDGKWEFVSGPSGVTAQQVFPGGSTYINADGVLPKAGDYKFRFILKGAPAVEITVNYGPTKTVTAFSSGTITYSDNSTEKGEPSYSAGKWTLKTAAGKIIPV